MNLDLLKPIHPSLRWEQASQKRFEFATDFPLGFSSSGLSNIRDLRWLLWLMTLSNKEIVSLNKRLHFTAPLMESLACIIEIHSLICPPFQILNQANVWNGLTNFHCRLSMQLQLQRGVESQDRHWKNILWNGGTSNRKPPETI